MKKTIHLLLLLFACLSVSAIQPEDKFRLPEQLLRFIMEGKGEQVHQILSDKVKNVITVGQMNGIWKELTSQLGAYQSKSDWKEENVAGQVVYYCDIQFAQMPLRFHTAFDKDSLISTLNFVPVPADSKVPTVKVDNVQMKETDIKVVTGKFELPGILCMPQGKESVPIAILISGSGPNDRDETVGVNKPFRDLAWGLAEQGIASIRFDKRTKAYGAQFVPQGEEMTMEQEYVQDVLSAVLLAKNIQGIDSQQIYIVGHSQGALLAPRLAQRSKEIKGIVLMSGNARRLEDLLPEQFGYIFSLDGLSKDEEKKLEEIKKQVANVKKLGTKDFNPKIALPFGMPASYWKDLNDYHQLEVAKSLTCPILILQGERDYQVTMEDFALWKKALDQNTNVTFQSFPNLNHLYMEGKGKSIPSEYSQVGTIPAYVTKDIADWIKKQNER